MDPSKAASSNVTGMIETEMETEALDSKLKLTLTTL